MATTVQRRPGEDELRELAHGWGKILAEQAYGPEGPGLDVDLAMMEEAAVQAAQALVAGFCESSTRAQTGRLTDLQPCPACGRGCERESGTKDRPIKLRVGEFQLVEPVYHCPDCRRDFFPSAADAAD